MRICLSAIILFLFSCSHSQNDDSISHEEINDWPESLSDIGINSTIAQNPKFRFQMVFTAIRDGSLNETISIGTDQYYYPASLVKIPTALIALEKMQELGISLNDCIVFDTVNACGSTRFVDLSKNQRISFRQMFTELFVVSDNNFYNSLYHFVSPEELNANLKAKGFNQTHIYRAFTGCEKYEQLHTYPWKVYRRSGELISRGEEKFADSNVVAVNYVDSEARLFGSSHENRDGKIVDGPFDLNFMPEMRLEDLQDMMLRFIYPENFKEAERWNISDQNRQFILDLMETYPSEISSSYRDISRFSDFVYKYGRNENRTISKLGLSYGFASETIYYQIPNSNDAFLLSYSVYVNSNDCVNDGKYEYEEVARPFAEGLFEAKLKYMKIHKTPPED